ncbi:hypothetical protein [Vagococcus fluvialis]|uniref:hypothetical protein n=1 Tax=Vagococcus fluvialis TaxID=2738 RepID=UPI001D0BB165|nr:hypothetical protein [Vagococcus fluvialis]UDM84093.1 hypothetical protein K5K96_15220 [Vagococcus fluvialis]
MAKKKVVKKNRLIKQLKENNNNYKKYDISTIDKKIAQNEKKVEKLYATLESKKDTKVNVTEIKDSAVVNEYLEDNDLLLDTKEMIDILKANRDLQLKFNNMLDSQADKQQLELLKSKIETLHLEIHNSEYRRKLRLMGRRLDFNVEKNQLKYQKELSNYLNNSFFTTYNGLFEYNVKYLLYVEEELVQRFYIETKIKDLTYNPSSESLMLIEGFNINKPLTMEECIVRAEEFIKQFVEIESNNLNVSKY